MIFINYHPAIDCEKSVTFVESLEEIINTKAGSLVVSRFDKNSLDFYSTLTIPFAVIVEDIEQFLLASATKIKYAICEKELASSLQELADSYLMDIKVLAKAKRDEIVTIAAMKIDGVFIVNQ